MSAIFLLVAALGGLPLGNQTTQIMDVMWRYIIAGSGIILLIVGVFLIWLEYRNTIDADKEKSTSVQIRKFDSDKEAIQYTLERIRDAKKSVHDLTIEKPLQENPKSVSVMVSQVPV